MSQTPDGVVEAEKAANYVDAWRTVTRWIHEGRSWSGRERNCSFLNIGGGRFANVSFVSGLDFLDDGRALAAVDWDFDGDLDLWLANRTAPQIRFMRNDTPSDNHFLALRLTGRRCNRDAIGARVELFVGDLPGRKLVTSLRSFSADDDYLYLNFGELCHRLDAYTGEARGVFGMIKTPERISLAEPHRFELTFQRGRGYRGKAIQRAPVGETLDGDTDEIQLSEPKGTLTPASVVRKR